MNIINFKMEYNALKPDTKKWMAFYHNVNLFKSKELHDLFLYQSYKLFKMKTNDSDVMSFDRFIEDISSCMNTLGYETKFIFMVNQSSELSNQFDGNKFKVDNQSIYNMLLSVKNLNDKTIKERFFVRESQMDNEFAVEISAYMLEQVNQLDNNELLKREKPPTINIDESIKNLNQHNQFETFNNKKNEQRQINKIKGDISQLIKEIIKTPAYRHLSLQGRYLNLDEEYSYHYHEIIESITTLEDYESHKKDLENLLIEYKNMSLLVMGSNKVKDAANKLKYLYESTKK